jgi:prevent-host-death family protein
MFLQSTMLDIRTDILPLTDFKRRTNEFVEQLRATGRPLVLTINGKPEIVVLDASAYQEMQERLSEQSLSSTGTLGGPRE